MKYGKRIAGVTLVVVMVAGGLAVRAGEEKKPLCPVSGEPVNLAVSTPTDKGPVFFCCKRCMKKFKGNPSKFEKDVAAQRAVLAKRDKVQVTCPVSGEPVDPKIMLEHKGQKVQFCCGKCRKKFKNDPNEFQVALANSYTFQTKCPVADEPIVPDSFTTLANGMKVFYCCQKCEKKLLENPKKYAGKLAEQGYEIAPKDIKKK